MVKVSDITVWDKSEVEEFLKVAIEDRYYIVFLLALTTGMRKGEILGLRWKDINLKGKYLTIHQTLKNDGTGFLKTPKTKSSRRRVHLSDNVVRALEKQKTRIGREKEEMKDSYTNNDLVACSIYGTPVNPANLRRSFNRLKKAADLKSIRFHDLRHTHATLLLAEGINVKVIAERLGHADTRITLDTYSHLLPSMQETAIDTIIKIFS